MITDTTNDLVGIGRLTKLELFTLVALHAQMSKSNWSPTDASQAAFEAARGAIDRIDHENRGLKS